MYKIKSLYDNKLEEFNCEIANELIKSLLQ